MSQNANQAKCAEDDHYWLLSESNSSESGFCIANGKPWKYEEVCAHCHAKRKVTRNYDSDGTARGTTVEYLKETMN